jgi:HlyD family secretion protein
MPVTRLKTALLVTVALCTLVGCKPETHTAQAPQPSHRNVTATLATVIKSPMSVDFRLSGVQVSREEAAVATELSGYRVAKVFVEPGAKVVAGQALATLDDTLLRSQIKQQEAAVAQQAVAYDRAVQEANRVKGLDSQGVLSTEAVTDRTLSAQSAKASLAQAQASLDDYNTRLSLMTIRAPVAGTVLTRAVRPGDIAATSSVMFTLARDGLVELEAQVPEAVQSQITSDTPAVVTLPGGKTLQGQVRLVSPNVDAQTKLGTVRIALPLDGALKPGGFGEASIAGGTRDVVVVPVSAVSYTADGASLFVVGAGNILQRRPIRTGAVKGDVIELLEGPPAGTQIVARGAALLLPGDHVTPAKIATEH